MAGKQRRVARHSVMHVSLCRLGVIRCGARPHAERSLSCSQAAVRSDAAAAPAVAIPEPADAPARRAVLGGLCWAAGGALTLAAGGAAEAGELAASQAQLNVARRRGEVLPAACLRARPVRRTSGQGSACCARRVRCVCCADAALVAVCVWTVAAGWLLPASLVLLILAARARTPGVLPWACMGLQRIQWQERTCVLQGPHRQRKT